MLLLMIGINKFENINLLVTDSVMKTNRNLKTFNFLTDRLSCGGDCVC